MHQLGELDPGTRCMGVFLSRSGGSREQCRRGSAWHTPERAHGKAEAAQAHKLRRSPPSGSEGGSRAAPLHDRPEVGIT